MNDLLTIYPTLVLIYLLQCFLLVAPGVKAFLVNSRLQGKLVTSPRHREPRCRRFLFLNPLSCFTQAMVVVGFPWTFLSNTTGELLGIKLSNAVATDGASSCLEFDMPGVFTTRKKELLLNGSVIGSLYSDYSATRVATTLNRLRAASVQGRLDELRREIRKMFSTKEIQRRLRLFLNQTAVLTTICFVLLLYVFVVAPIAVYLFGLLHVWPALVFTLILNCICIAWTFGRAHRQLYFDRPSGRAQHLVTIALSPLAAIRATDLLALNLLEDFHPIAVAQVLLPKPAFLKFAESELRRIRFNDRDAIMEECLTTFLSGQKIVPNSLLVPPAPDGANSRSYCPACLTQYVFVEGACSECPGVSVHPFTPRGAVNRQAAADNSG